METRQGAANGWKNSVSIRYLEKGIIALIGAVVTIIVYLYTKMNSGLEIVSQKQVQHGERLMRLDQSQIDIDRRLIEIDRKQDRIEAKIDQIIERTRK